MTEPQPLPPKALFQFVVFLLVLVALAGGYYQTLDENWQLKYNQAQKLLRLARQELSTEKAASELNATNSAGQK